uniref:Adrenal ferredoxin n=1 Tax=Suricata suricatta TaxID=37032 RepID=A0A673UB89_SURSU
QSPRLPLTGRRRNQVRNRKRFRYLGVFHRIFPSNVQLSFKIHRPAAGTREASSEEKITVHFVNRDGETLTAKGKVGDSLLDVVVENNLDIDGFGACEGTLACSTCHLIFEDHIFEKLDAVTDEESDMLDLAYGLTDRSRLGCQICLTKSMDNMTVRVPDVVADARQSVDNFGSVRSIWTSSQRVLFLRAGVPRASFGAREKPRPFSDPVVEVTQHCLCLFSR